MVINHCERILTYWGSTSHGNSLSSRSFCSTKYGSSDAVEAGAIVSIAPTRTYVDEDDSDNDGTPDWEEDLALRVTDTIKIPEGTTAVPSYEKPNTFTGQFAESFFTDYLNTKANGGGAIDTQGLVKSAVMSVEQNTASKIYTSSDIEITENTEENIREYGNAIARIMLAQPSSGENEVMITKRAIETDNPNELKKLAIPKASYKQMLADTVEVPTPATYAGIQTQLLSAYEAIYSDISAMEQSFNDPLYALARIKRYYEDAVLLQSIVKTLNEKLLSDGIHFEESEPASFFYTLQL